MEKHDILVIGGATSGCYISRLLARHGYDVLVVDKLSLSTLGKRLDIFHMTKREMAKYNVPVTHKGDGVWQFEFAKNYTYSPHDGYPKYNYDEVIGMHMPEYIALMRAESESAGTEFRFEYDFTEFIFENGKIVGARFLTPEGEKEIFARIVIDCTGADAKPRTSLPSGYIVENTPLGGNDKFYVTLRYVKLKKPEDYVNASGEFVSRSWTYYKTWLAPCSSDGSEGIIGIGACESYDHGEEIFKVFESNVQLPPHEVVRIERGTTPYMRPPYSFVGDNYVVTGDAGCLTKPNNGEGVTSSMEQMLIVEKVVDEALKKDDTSKEALWKINVEYNKVQGADFASTRALFTKAVGAEMEEWEYLFKKSVIFDDRFFDGGKTMPPSKTPVRDALHLVAGILGGLISGNLSLKTLKGFASGLSLGGKLKKLYLDFPVTPAGFGEWKEKADALWLKVGKMK